MVSATTSAPNLEDFSLFATAYASPPPTTLETRAVTATKPISSTTEALSASLIPVVSEKILAARNDSQFQTPTPTSTPTATATPVAPTDKQQHINVSRKWKTVALTLAIILGAIIVMGLVACVSCGWYILDLMDRPDAPQG